MTKRFWKTRLGVELIFVTLCSIVIAFLVFTVLSFLEIKILMEKFNDISFIEANTERVAGDLQKYVTDYRLSSFDMPEIDRWVRQKRNAVLMMYDGNRVVYDSSIVDFLDAQELPVRDNNHYRRLYTIQFSDKALKAELFCFFEYRFSAQVNYMKIGAAICCFAISLLLFIKRKTQYIDQLAGEIGILEGGNLEYKITVQGNDELTDLARSIDHMRMAVIERQREEQKAINGSHKLIAAMSHDLKTPLTILIGYLDILEGKKLKDNTQQDVYISKSREKAYQIKQLSDKIFEYFLAVDTSGDRLHKEIYSAGVLCELIEDYIFTLEEKGFQVLYEAGQSCLRNGICIDMQYIHRVFDNIFSNLLKYADPRKEVRIVVREAAEDGAPYLAAVVENYIDERRDRVESSNIGLETCQSIMEQHGGVFIAVRREKIFTVEARFFINS